MATPLAGPHGVGTTKGDLFIVDVNEELERVPIGVDGQLLQADSSEDVGVKWVDLADIARATMWGDGLSAIFKKINLGAGALSNPQTKSRGTHSVLAFDDSSIEGIVWQQAMPQIYSDNDLVLSLYWVAGTAVMGDVIWAAGFERDQDAGHDIDSESFAALKTAAASTAPGSAGIIQKASLTFTQAEADAIVAGDPFRLFIQRTGDDGSDDMVGDAQLVRWVLNEAIGAP